MPSIPYNPTEVADESGVPILHALFTVQRRLAKPKPEAHGAAADHASPKHHEVRVLLEDTPRRAYVAGEIRDYLAVYAADLACLEAETIQASLSRRALREGTLLPWLKVQRLLCWVDGEMLMPWQAEWRWQHSREFAGLRRALARSWQVEVSEAVAERVRILWGLDSMPKPGWESAIVCGTRLARYQCAPARDGYYLTSDRALYTQCERYKHTSTASARAGEFSLSGD